MLTLKVIDDNGIERVKGGVVATQFEPEIGETGKCAQLFVWYQGDEPAETIQSGKIYVMNESGKTIADYYIVYHAIGMSQDVKA